MLKATMFNKNGFGIVVGRLVSPNEVQFESDGKLIRKTLENPLETEYNDVVIAGYKNSDGTIRVVNMESLPTEKDDPISWVVAETLTIIAAYKNNIHSIKKFSNENGNYLEFKILLEKNTYATLRIPEKDAEKDKECYVFMLPGIPKWTEKVIGTTPDKPYLSKTLKLLYGYGKQMLT